MTISYIVPGVTLLRITDSKRKEEKKKRRKNNVTF